LRYTLATETIAKSLGYTPEKNESIDDIMNRVDISKLNEEQKSILQDMLQLVNQMKESIDQEPDDDIEWSDDDIDQVLDRLGDDDYLEAYDDDEFVVVDDESGEILDEDIIESKELNEILSRAERLKARVRFARTTTKREAKARLALKKHSNSATINKRARRLAISAMKMKLAKRPMGNLSVAEKERIERIVARRKNLIDRMALKMVPRVKKIEKDRLSHRSVTQ
jgi:hypothetical protein